MIYKYNEIVSAKALSDLRESVGWNRMEEEYENPLMTSYYHIAVYENDNLIGYIDCVSNGVTDAYIQDLMVHPEYQGEGVGTELMKYIHTHSKNIGCAKLFLITNKSNVSACRCYENAGGTSKATDDIVYVFRE